MKIDPDIVRAMYQNNFYEFVCGAYAALYPNAPFVPNWHIRTICYAVERMVTHESRNRLVVNLPPRTLKSFILSVCLPAWLLGRNPGKKIVCASYSHDLADKFSRLSRALMETAFYKRVFPHTRLNPKKITEGEFETRDRGFRFATSVGGTLTGHGGDVLIIDDPIKELDANSPLALEAAYEWYRGTATNRLNSMTDELIIVTMQRLHQNDLSGKLIDKGWPCLAIPAIATEPADFLVGEHEIYHRPTGEMLQPNRDSLEALEEKKRDVGSRNWAAKYNQNPITPEGNIIKADWLAPRYDFDPKTRRFQQVVLSCDPAGKAGAHNDYTAITICGFDRKPIHLLHVARGHWSVLEMYRRIEMLASDWNVGRVIIEDTSSGMGLIQMLRENSRLHVMGRRPDANKEVRIRRHEALFEAGNFLLPKEEDSWLPDFLRELLAFPNGRYDDQVDALLLFLDWFAKWTRFDATPRIECGLPIVG